MNQLEERLAAALRDTGEEISPHSVPPLRLRGARRRVTLPRLPRRWMAWLTPLAAAAAVAAVVATSLAISATFHGHTRSNGSAGASRWNGSPLGPRSALHKVPPYFVELPWEYEARTAMVRSTVTGRVLTTVRPPRPYKVFTFVSGTADDRTFVLAAQRWWNIPSGGARAQKRDVNARTVFFKLTFDPATRKAQFTRLAVPGKILSRDLGGMGVSPDGTRLALDLRKSIQIINLATGATRTWTWPGGGWIGNFKPHGQVFSWSADGKTLAFQQWGGYLDTTAHVRLLDTTAPGHSLAAAKVILTFLNKEGVLTFGAGNTLLTADGSKIVTATGFYSQDSRLGYQNITEFSVRTGEPVLSQDKFGTPAGGEQKVFWASPDGSVLVVSDPRGAKTQDGYPGGILGVLAGNKFTPIPHGAYNFDQVAW